MRIMVKEEIEYYRKMSAEEKLQIVSDMFEFFRKAKREHSKKVGNVKKIFELVD